MLRSFFLTLFFFFYRSLKIVGLSLLMVVQFAFLRLTKKEYSRLFPALLRAYFERIGGSFIKLGQTLSMRQDVLPLAYCEELSSLLDQVKPTATDKFLRLLDKAWKGKTYEFLNEEKPRLIASASFAQVYEAVTREGEKVAIKIQRPFIKPVLQVDIFYIRSFSFFLFLSGLGNRLGLNKLIEELIEALKNEIDYEKEALVLDTFYSLSTQSHLYCTPKLYPEYCTANVLCMELFEGVWMTEIIRQIQLGTLEEFSAEQNFNFSLSQLSEQLYEVLMTQIYEQNCFHADPHAGNIVILKNGQIGLVDFGIVGVFDKEDQKKQQDYLMAISIGDINLALDRFVDILEPTPSSKFVEIKQEFRFYLMKWMHSQSLSSEYTIEKTSGYLVTKSIDLVRKYHFRFPKNIMLYYKTVFILEHILFTINPGFNMVARTQAFLGESLQNNLQRKLEEKTNLLYQLSQIESLLDFDLAGLLKSWSVKEKPAQEKRFRSFYPQLARISLFAFLFSLGLKLIFVDFHIPLLQWIHEVHWFWFLLIGTVLFFITRKYYY